MASRSRGGGGDFRIDHKGVAEMLKTESGIQSLIEGMTSTAAAEARDRFPEGFTVLDGVLSTDRPQGNVTVANRSAQAMNGKYGYLDQSAQAAGFEAMRGK